MLELFKQDRPLEELAAERRYVKIARFFDTPPLYGFVLAAGRELVLIQNENDFLLDGYSVLRRQDVSRAAIDGAVAFHEKLLKAEQIAPQAGIGQEPSLGGWRDLFADLRRLGRNVIVQCEDPADGLFAIGRIVRVGAKSVLLRQFDALGRLDASNTSINYGRITLVSFDTRYLNVFSRHLREQGPKRSRK